MKKIILVVALATLAACKPSSPSVMTDHTNTTVQSKPQRDSSGPHVTFFGPRIGFDGQLKIGGMSPGFGL